MKQLTLEVSTNNLRLPPTIRWMQELAAEYPEHLVLFDDGKFINAYCETSHRFRAAMLEVCGIELTAAHGCVEFTDMAWDTAGFPNWKRDRYIPALVEAGYSVVIASEATARNNEAPTLFASGD